uniref:DNA-directed RNA polymerase subunit beta'' n=1 Tax=Pediastrum angulosum TaxID=271408 RepID=A0A2U8GHQ0_9CHLO|nr:RNA polymerase beta subunit [Pediastrum angulosum]
MQKLIFLIKKNKLLSNKPNKLNNIKSGETRFCCTFSLCSHISSFAHFHGVAAKALSPRSAGELKRFEVVRSRKRTEAKQKSGSHMQPLHRSISTSLVLSTAKTANAKKNFCIKSTNRPIDNFNLFWNCAFDKGRLKSFVLWFLNTYGEYKTIELLEQLKNLGFGYATKAGVSLGIDDLKIPSQKFDLINQAESNIFKGIEKYKKGQITGVERLQQLIDVWNQTSEFLKQEVIRNFETTDLFNPVYMMAFSGARGNISQVRQLVGMRGLMSDPQGNIIDFPIQSNFREGLTLTEYIISTYGARKGIVDTALRTATAGYLTRRLVDVAQHVMISQFDCGTTRGIFLFDMKEGGKTIYSFQNRLIGRVLANDIDFAPFDSVGFAESTAHEKAKEQSKSNNKESYIMKAYRNQEISAALAVSIAKITKKAFVRSPLTCETRKLVCQLCYGWGLASSKLVSLGEAVGVIAAQSIGEPGTQLTMRTFHTGGVFSGGLTNQIIASYDGYVEYSDTIPGTCIRTPQGDISFLTKAQGSFFIKEKDFLLQENVFALGRAFGEVEAPKRDKLFRSDFYTIPAYAILFARNKQQIFKKQIVAQFSSIGQQQVQRGNAEQTVYAELEGEISFSQIDLLEQQNEKLFEDVVLKAIDWSKIWILSGKIYYDPLGLNSFGINGDFFNRNTTFQKIYWQNLNSCFFDIPLGIRSLRERDKQKNKILIFKGIKRFSLTKNRDFFYKKRILNSTFNSFKSSLLSFDSLGEAESDRTAFALQSERTKELKKLTDSQKNPNQKYKKFEQKESILNINIDNFNLNRENAIFFNKIPKNFYIKGFKNRLVLLLNKKTLLNNEVQQNFEIFSKSKIVFSKFYNNKNARFYKIDDSLQLKRIKQKMNLLYEKMIKNYYLKNFKNIKFNMINSYTNKENHKNDLKLVGVNKVHRLRFGFGNAHRTFGLQSEKADRLKTNSLHTFGFADAKGNKQKKKKIAKKICLYNKKEKTTNIVTLKALLKNKTNSLYYYPFRTFIRFFLFKKINRIHFLSYYMKKALKSSVTKKKKKLKYLISDVNTTKQTNIKKLMNPFMLKNSIPNFLKKKTIKKRIFSTIPEIENSLYDIYNFKKVKKTDIKNYSVLSQSFISKLNEKKQNLFDIKGHSAILSSVQLAESPKRSFDSVRKALIRFGRAEAKEPKAKNINNRIINGFYKRKPILTFPVNKISFKKFGYIFSINKSNNYNLKSKIKADFILSYFPLTNSYNTPISSSNINDPGKNFQKLSLGNTLNFSPFSNIAFRWFPLDSQTISNGIYIWSRNFLINERTIEKNIKTYNKVYKENPDFYISNYYFFQKKRWIHLNGLFKKYNKKEIFNFNKYMNKLAQNIKNKNFIYINNYSFSQSKIGASLLCQSEVKNILLFDFFASASLREQPKQAEAETEEPKRIDSEGAKEPKGIEFKNNKKNEIMCFSASAVRSHVRLRRSTESMQEKKLNNQLQIYEKYRKKSYNLKFRYDLTLNQRLRIFVTKKYVKKLFYFNQSTFKEIEDILKIKTPFFNYITKFSKFSVYKQDFYYIPQENSRFNIFNIPFFLGSSDQYIRSLSRFDSVDAKTSQQSVFNSSVLLPRSFDSVLRLLAEQRTRDLTANSEQAEKREEGEKQKSSENKFGNQLSFKFYLSNRQGFKKSLPSEVSGLTRIYTQIPKKNLKTKLTNKNFGKIQKKEFLISCLYNNNLKNNVLIPKKFNKKTIYPQNNKKHKNFISSIKIKKASYNMDLNIRHKMSSNIFKKFLKKQKNKQFGIHSSKEQANSNLKNIQCSNLYKNYDFNKNLSHSFTSSAIRSRIWRSRSTEPNHFDSSSAMLKKLKSERADTKEPSLCSASEAESAQRQRMHKRIEEKPFIAQLKNQSFFFSCIPFISCQQSIIDSKQASHSQSLRFGSVACSSLRKKPKHRRAKWEGAEKIKNKPFISTSQVERIKKPGWVYMLIDSYEKLKIKNFLSFKTLHQTFANEGKKVIHDICFEQNKIYIENVTLSPNSSLYSLSNISKLYTNKNCRFFNGFVSTMLFSAKREKKKNISIHKINQNNLALLFRPIQHKILTNPQLLKKQISNNQKNSYNNYSILFYKDYHSNLLNLQNCPKKSLSKFPSVDFQIRQVSQNINLYSLNHSRYRTIKEHSYNKKKLKNNVDSFASAALSTVKKKPSASAEPKRQSEKSKKNANCFITLYNNKTPVKLKKQSYDKKVSFYTKKYSMYNKPYYFSNIYYSAYKIHSFSLELKNTKPLGLDFGFNIPTIILKPSYSNVIKQQNLNFLGIHLSSLTSAEPMRRLRQSEKPKKEQEKNYSKNLRKNNLSQMFYYLMKKNMLRKLWVSKTVSNFSIDSYKNWFNKNRVSSINLKTNLNSFFAFFYLYPLPFIEWSLTRKEDYLANNVLSSNKKIQNTKNCLFPNSFYKNFFNNNIKFQNMKNSIINYKQAGILNLCGASTHFGKANAKELKTISMQPFSIAFPLIKNSFLLYKAYNKILANQVYATTNLLSPFEGELLTQNNKNKWWNQSAETELTHKKLNLKHYIFLTKKDMFSISLDLNSNAKMTKYIQQNKKIDINEYLSLFSTLYSNYTNLFNKNIKQQTQKKLFDKLKSSNLNNLNVHCVRTLSSSSLREKTTSEGPKLHRPTSLASLAKPNPFALRNERADAKELMQSKDSFEASLESSSLRLAEPLRGSNPKEQDKYFSTHKKKKYNILNFVTKYQNKIYKLRGLSIGKVSENKVLNLHLGKFLLKGDNISLGYAEPEQDQKIDKTGQLIHLNSKKITLRYAQPFLISPKGILHVQQGDYVYRNTPIITLPFETLTTGDIVQGIPKVEQYLEARTTQNGRFFLYSLPVLQKAIFERYRAKLPLEQAVAQSFLKIQQIIVDGVQRVYRSQGVSIAEKHLEVIVKQMTSKVQIIHGGQTGFFPGELVDLEIVESVNKFLMVKIRYEPIVLGITRASLEVESFLSAASFQQTTKILAKASLSKKKDYLKGLKENLLVGNLIPAGTGFMNSY